MAHDHPHGHPHGHGHARGHRPERGGGSVRGRLGGDRTAGGGPRGAGREPGGDHAPDHDHAGPGHNRGGAPLHSHVPTEDAAADLAVLAAQFIDGFREARDKAAFLAIAGVPREIDGAGGPPLKLVDVRVSTEWQVGTAAPSFGSRELSYLPYPGPMIDERTNMGFVYVSLDAKRVVDLREFLSGRHA